MQRRTSSTRAYALKTAVGAVTSIHNALTHRALTADLLLPRFPKVG